MNRTSIDELARDGECCSGAGSVFTTQRERAKEIMAGLDGVKGGNVDGRSCCQQAGCRKTGSVGAVRWLKPHPVQVMQPTGVLRTGNAVG